MKTVPAVSIIIPMYNAEKYIGACLDSILAQTFTDFEVIVVDDCSTDNSRAVVESYLQKFNVDKENKLQLFQLEKNSGAPGIPRNVGMRLSISQYIMFVDSDDSITSTALEEIYPIAKNFDADIVYCEKFYKVDIGETFTTDKDRLTVKVGWNTNYNFVTEPKLNTQKEECIKDFGTKKFWTACWNFLFKRNFIMEKNISFPLLRIGEDEIFVFKAICLAKNIVRVPNIIYTWRRHSDAISSSLESITLNQNVERWVNSVFFGIALLDEFMNSLDFFRNHIEYKYLILESFLLGKQGHILPMFAQISPYQLDGLLRKELENVENKTALTAFLFSRMNVFNVALNNQAAILRQTNAHIQKQNELIQNLQEKIKLLQADSQ